MYIVLFFISFEWKCTYSFSTYHIIAITIGIVTITTRAITTHKIAAIEINEREKWEMDRPQLGKAIAGWIYLPHSVIVSVHISV